MNAARPGVGGLVRVWSRRARLLLGASITVGGLVTLLERAYAQWPA